jgi:hypothetical protein
LVNDLINIIKARIPYLNSKEVVEVTNLLLDKIDDNQIIITATTLIHVDDVFYLCQQKKNVIEIVTNNDTYIYTNKPNDDLLENLDKNHKNFKFINNNSMANTNKIIMYDYFLKRIYFTNDKSKYVVTTVAAMEQIKKVLSKELDISRIFGEYSQTRKAHC